MSESNVLAPPRESQSFLDGAARIGPLVALLGAMPIMFAGLAPFRFGFWDAAEPVVFAFHATASISSAALVLAWLRHPMRCRDAIVHPFVVLPGMLAAWGLITAPFAEFPMLSVLGPPQSGEGVLWWANIAVYVACMRFVVESDDQRRFLVTAAIVVGLAIASVHAASLIVHTGFLFRVTDYIAYFALALPFIGLRIADGDRVGLFVAAAIVAFAALVVSENRAALVLMFPVVGIAVVGGFVARKHWFGPAWLPRLIGSLIVALFAVYPYVAINTLALVGNIDSVRSRHLVNQVMREAQQTDFPSLLLGNGWGHTLEAMVVHLHAAKENIWLSKWDFLSRDWFHSHNWISESLYTVGLPGLLLTFLVFLAIPAFCDRDKIAPATAYAAGLAALNTVWFQLAFTVPVMAMALGVLSTNSRPTTRPGQTSVVRQSTAPIILTVLGAGQAISAAALLSFGLDVSAVRRAYVEPTANAAAMQFPSDFHGVHYALANSARDHVETLRKSTSMPEPSKAREQRDAVAVILRELHAKIVTVDSAYLTIAGISILSDIVYDPNLAWLRSGDVDHIDHVDLLGIWVDRLLDLAPERTDVAIPYFARLLERGSTTKLADVARRFLTQNPNDPVSLFYLGGVLMLEGRPESRSLAFAYLRQSLELGVERFMPVDSQLKKRILESGK